MSQATSDALESAAEPGRLLGNRVMHLPETGSTMDDAWRLAGEGAGEGLVIVADAQTAGRGRHGRRWSSQAGRDLLFSILMRPRPAIAHELLMIASLACRSIVTRASALDVSLKWPNDVLCDGRKVAGVLAESRQDAEGLVVVVGVGLNVNLDVSAVVDAPNATSLLELTGRAHSRVQILRDLLDQMSDMYRALMDGATLVPEWREALETLGRRVAVSSVDPRSPGLLAQGVARDVDDLGRLLVEGDDGMTRAVAAGEVTLRAGEGR